MNSILIVAAHTCGLFRKLSKRNRFLSPRYKGGNHKINKRVTSLEIFFFTNCVYIYLWLDQLIKNKYVTKEKSYFIKKYSKTVK